MTRGFLFASLAAVAVLGFAPGLAAPANKAAAAKDWSRTVVMTPEGGFRMGNPAAKVKLVEYGSLTCPHCADFSKSASGPIAAAVKSGKLSFEYRSMVLNGIDAAATLLARCGGPTRFFAISGKMFATQEQWLSKISGVPKAEQDKTMALPVPERLARVAELGGLTQLAAQSGVTPDEARKCLTDPAAHQRLGQMYEAATALGIEGTPAFFINGNKVHAHDWAELQPLIRKAGG